MQSAPTAAESSGTINKFPKQAGPHKVSEEGISPGGETACWGKDRMEKVNGIFVPLMDSEHKALNELAARQEISPEKVMILGLRLYQLHAMRVDGILEELDRKGGGCSGQD